MFPSIENQCFDTYSSPWEKVVKCCPGDKKYAIVALFLANQGLLRLLLGSYYPILSSSCITVFLSTSPRETSRFSEKNKITVTLGTSN